MNREDREFEETLELLREAHREPIAEAHYAAVRARVVAQLAGERRVWRGWIWACGLAVAAVLLVGRAHWGARGPLALRTVPLVGVSRVSERPAGGPAADQGVRPTLVAGAKERASVRRRLVSVRGARIDNPRQVDNLPHKAYLVTGPPALQPLVVKLVTDDPNIVIYWISGE